MKKQHGGPRPGSGRKRLPESHRSTTMQIRIPKKMMDSLQKEADRLGTSKNEVIKRAVGYALYDKLGSAYFDSMEFVKYSFSC